MSGYTDKALMAHMKSGLHTGFTGMNAQIATIAANSTAKFYLTLKELGLPANAICLILGAVRTAGAGNLMVYAMDEALGFILGSDITLIESRCVAVDNERVEFCRQQQGSAWTVWCFGYWTKGQVLG